LADSTKVMEAADENAKTVIAFDMDAAAGETDSAISAVMLGAVAQSSALPFAVAAYEEAIRTSGIATDANLKGFSAGLEGRDADAPTMPHLSAEEVIAEGVRRLVDYQDKDYADLYLKRLGAFDGELRREVARGLALWMSYEDTMRVAQQKIRASRMNKIRAEVNAQPEQILHVVEYMHPRWQELCDTLPSGIGGQLERGDILKRVFAPMFEKGRHVRSTSVRWFILLNVLASHRRARRGTLRYGRENKRIETWLSDIAGAPDAGTALELAECQNLIKGYGETHERGLRKFTALMDAYRLLRGEPDVAQKLRALREIASKDEDGSALSAAIEAIPVSP